MLMDQSQYLVTQIPVIWCMYPIILIARGAAILIHYPLLKRLGTGCDWKCAVVMWWGGLRGSVGLALALAIGHTVYSHSMWNGDMLEDDAFRLPCRDIPHAVEMCTLMVVFLTVCINGMTMAPLMRLLKMTELPEHRKYMLRKAAAKIEEETEEHAEKIKKANGFEHVDWAAVDLFLWKGDYAEAASQTERSKRLAIINVERASYEHIFTSGLLSSHAHTALEKFISDAAAECSHTKDASRVPELYDKVFKTFVKQMEADFAPKWYDRFRRPAKAKRVAVAYQTFYAYMHGIEQAEHAYKAEFSRDTGTEKGSCHFEYEDNEAEMTRVLANLESSEPDLVRVAQTRLVARQLLTRQYEQVDHMLHEGELLDLDAAALKKEINDKLCDATVDFEGAVRRRQNGNLGKRTVALGAVCGERPSGQTRVHPEPAA